MTDGTDKIRKDYEDLFGKKPFNGWDAAELQKRIDDKLAEGNSTSGEAESKADKPAPKAAKAAAASSDPYPSQAELDAMRTGTYVNRELKSR